MLDQAAAFLKANAGVNVEVGGHTDGDGADAANLDLSQRRADAVKAHLVEAGITAERIGLTIL